MPLRRPPPLALPGPAGALLPAAVGADSVPAETLVALDAWISGLFDDTLAPSTRRAYETDWRAFALFLRASGQPLQFPISPVAVAGFLGVRSSGSWKPFLASPARARPRSLARALAAIDHACARHGSPCVTDEAVVRRAIRKVRIELGMTRANKRALLPARLEEAIAAAAVIAAKDGSSPLLGLRNAAMCRLGIAAALRRSELVAVRVEDLEFGEDRLALTLPRSKTDQEGKGCVVPVTGPAISSLRQWLEAAQVREGPVFRAIEHGQVMDSLGDRTVSLVVKAYMGALGLSPAEQRPWGGHSLRSGFATAAARAKWPLEEIRRHMRHKNSDTTRLYVEAAGVFDGPKVADLWEVRK